MNYINTMKKNYIFLIFITLSIKAQTWTWAKNYDIDQTDWGTSIGIDSLKNIYMTGNSNYFTGGGGSRMHEWLSKFDKGGNLLWRDTIDFIDNHLVTLNNGECFVTGGDRIAKFDKNGNKIWNISTSIFGSFTSIDFQMTGVIVLGRDSSKTILGKYDLNGNQLWWKKGIFPLASKIKIDQHKNIYAVGTGPTNTTTINFGVLTKCDSNGNVIYSRSIPHTPTDISIDKNSNIYITGWFANQPIEIGSTVYPAGVRRQYLIKYDSLGTVKWHRVYKGESVIESDGDNNLYVATAYAENIAGINAAAGNLICHKTDTDGNILWYKSTLCTDAPGPTQGYINAYDIQVKENAIYIGGSTSGHHTLDDYTLSANNTYSDIFLSKIEQSAVVEFIELNKISSPSFTLFPNPSSGLITIHSTSVKNVELRIENVLGQLLYSKKVNTAGVPLNETINLSQYPKGIYFVQINTGKVSEVRKIVLE